MLKIIVITQNEPFYIPKMIKHLIDYTNNKYEIIGYTALKPTRKSKSMFYWFKERARIYTYFELLLVAFLFIFTKLINTLKLYNSPYSVRSVFQKGEITEIITKDINSESYISKLQKQKPDIILSISCPQVFKENILKIPKIYCINAHGTLLPRHRGVFGSFWPLYYNEEEAGATLHTMELKLDAGEILWQEKFPITDRDTQYSIAYKTKKQMALALVEIFNSIISNKLSFKAPIYKSSYHRAPTKAQGKEFHKKGLRILRLNDFKLILAKKFI